jgi:hypothetical protein
MQLHKLVEDNSTYVITNSDDKRNVFAMENLSIVSTACSKIIGRRVI